MQRAHKALLSLATVSALAISPLAVSHFNDQEPMQSYRQSAFTLMAMNFGPMNAMPSAANRSANAAFSERNP